MIVRLDIRLPDDTHIASAALWEVKEITFLEDDGETVIDTDELTEQQKIIARNLLPDYIDEDYFS